MLSDKRHCLLGGHVLVSGAERDQSSDRSGRSIILLSRSSVEETREGRCQRRAPFRQQLRLDIDVAPMNVTPAPGLATFEGRNQRMTGRVEMLQSVRVLRILAAPDVAAGETDAKLV